MAGREVLGFGEQPGTAGGLPLPSVPFPKYTLELAPEKITCFADRVKAEGKLRPNVFGATTYCAIFWLPSGRTASAVTSRAWRAVGGGAFSGRGIHDVAERAHGKELGSCHGVEVIGIARQDAPASLLETGKASIVGAGG